MLQARVVEGDVGFKELNALFYAGTRKHHGREVALSDVPDILDEMEDFVETTQVLFEAFQAGLYREDPGKKAAPKKARKTREPVPEEPEEEMEKAS